MKLVNPSLRYEDSYLAYVREIREKREKPVPFFLDYPADDFAALIQRFENDSKGIGIPEGFVPASAFWLLGDSGEVVATSSLRHRLSPKLEIRGGHIGYGVRPSARGNGYAKEVLRLTILEARILGIADILITTDKENYASIAVIKANGGVFAEEEFIPEENEVIQRYWIGK